MSAKCSICLSALQDPVCIPCGHVYCTKCLSDHVNTPSNEDITASCPTCRTVFNLVTPDLTYLPKKYHTYIVPGVRRVYIDTSGYTVLEKKLLQAEARIEIMQSNQDAIVRQYEQAMTQVRMFSQAEKQTRTRLKDVQDTLERTVDSMEEKCEAASLEAHHTRDEIASLRSKYERLKRHFRELETQLKEGSTNLPRASDHKGKGRPSAGGVLDFEGSIAPTMSSYLSPQPDEPAGPSSNVKRKYRPLPRVRRLSQANDVTLPLTDRPKRPRFSEPGARAVLPWE